MAKNPYRALAAGLLGSFGLLIGSQIVLGHRASSGEEGGTGKFLAAGAAAFLPSAPGADAGAGAETPGALPALYAAPAELSRADTLHRGETLSQLLQRAELDAAEARALLAELAAHQDPRTLRPGAVLRFRRSAETGSVRGLEMRLDADRTLAVRREGDGWSSAVEEVEVRADTAVLSGEVSSSLYGALMAGGDDLPRREREWVADMLADRIFAWKVDFSRDLRRGDRFRILYERMVRPDGTARTARVLAVQFRIAGRDYEAYAFPDYEGNERWFDRGGESLKGGFLRAPLEFRRISSAFSRSRFHPVLKRSRPHYGIDYAAGRGTPIRAVGDGVVVRAGGAGGYGNLVEIRHSRGYSTRYAHMQRFASGIRSGARVVQGQVIGYVGSSGLATGPHLHYEFRENGRPVDPNSARNLKGDPVPSSRRGEFDAERERLRALLDRTTEPVLLADFPAEDAGARAGD